MRKVEVQYTAMHRHPGFLSCSTTRNNDPFWGGKRYCDLHTQFNQTFSILSFQVARQEYLIGKSTDQKNRKKFIRTTLFIN